MLPVQEKIFGELIANSQELLTTAFNYLLSQVVANVDLSTLGPILNLFGKRDLAQHKGMEIFTELLNNSQEFLISAWNLLVGSIVNGLGKRDAEAQRIIDFIVDTATQAFNYVLSLLVVNVGPLFGLGK